MQDTLNRLNISLKVVWEPLVSSGRHGEIKDGFLLIYDREENDVWSTFVHEIVEYRLKEVTRVYRQLINSLIEGYESLAYSSKEKFIDSLPSIFEAVAAERGRA